MSWEKTDGKSILLFKLTNLNRFIIFNMIFFSTSYPVLYPAVPKSYFLE